MKYLPDDDVFLSYSWFIGHVESLALDPISCCESQGYYNVAHELWYFIRTGGMSDSASEILSEEQRRVMDHLCKTVAEVPEEARRWTTDASESVKNMQHEAWRDPRNQATQLLAAWAPLITYIHVEPN